MNQYQPSIISSLKNHQPSIGKVDKSDGNFEGKKQSTLNPIQPIIVPF
jgi:hypothetical protein